MTLPQYGYPCSYDRACCWLQVLWISPEIAFDVSIIVTRLAGLNIFRYRIRSHTNKIMKTVDDAAKLIQRKSFRKSFWPGFAGLYRYPETHALALRTDAIAFQDGESIAWSQPGPLRWISALNFMSQQTERIGECASGKGETVFHPTVWSPVIAVSRSYIQTKFWTIKFS